VVWLGQDRYEAELGRETGRLAAALARIEPETPVPTCPEWTVRDLATHVGTGHRWASEIVEGRLQSPPPYVTVNAPQESRAWADWLMKGAQRLAEAVRRGPHWPVWTWRPHEGTAGFWLRKMVHDELVHRFDAELAGGRMGRVAPDLAADGVSDLLASIATLSPADSPDPIFAGLVGHGQTLQLLATDAGRAVAEWHVVRTPAGVRWRLGSAPADVAIRAPARELLLVLNRRLDPTEHVEVIGDHALFTHWLGHTTF
jgi:uncharacterized protein (TIGR03083 family)